MRTAIALGWIGQVATLSAIVCTLVPNPGDAHPIASVLKIVASAAAMALFGLVLYWFANRRRAAATEAAEPPRSDEREVHHQREVVGSHPRQGA